MKIAEFLKVTAIDYSGKIASGVFVSGCNYRCPACHNKNVVFENSSIDEEEIFSYLDFSKGFIDGVVISGGEPTIQEDLPNFLRKIKERGLAVKLDTNGSNPGMMERLLKEKLVDYVAMDVKGPVSLYLELIGKEGGIFDLRDNLGKGIGLTACFPEYEYRTTIVPIIENGKARWMTNEEIADTGNLIYEWTENREHKYFLQKFVPRKDGLIDSRLESFQETPDELMKEAYEKVREILPRVKIR